MIAEFGHFVLVLALCVAVVQGVGVLVLQRVSALASVAQANITQASMVVARRAAYAQFALLLMAFVALSTAFVRSDFSLHIVYANSHVAKPLIYKLAGVWGNHEGSMLLWTLILAAYGAMFAATSKALPEKFTAWVLVVQGWIGVAFLSFLLFTSNPFMRLLPAPFIGRGLTPVLQDPALAAHPPLLYAGYVGFSIVYAFALAALFNSKAGSEASGVAARAMTHNWARWMRPWILTAWVFLTLGIALGSFWAYYELGWGGFWFWDPVENASLMPWLSGTALLHSSLVLERRDTLKRWTLLLAIVTFSLSLAGTFLVRSGVLTSVHAFANDPERGLFILAILALFTGGGLVAYAVFLPRLKPDYGFRPMSREGLLLGNNIFLGTATVTVFIGTIYPLVLDTLGLGKISVGAPYFNAVFAPLTLPFLLLMPLGPLLGWQSGELRTRRDVLVLAALAAVIMALGVALIQNDPQFDVSVLMLALVGAAVWVILGALIDLAGKLAPYGGFNGGLAWRRPWRLLPVAFAAPLAHGGLAVLVLGVIIASTFRLEVVRAIAPGEQFEIGSIVLRFDGVREFEGVNFRAERGRLTYLNGPHQGTSLFPERRFYQAERAQTTEAAINTGLTGHLYAVIGEPDNGKRVVRVWYHPFVAFIWLGALMMALGGVCALIARARRAGAASGTV